MADAMRRLAAILNITPGTAAFHIHRMMERLQLKTNADLIQFAIRAGIVPLERHH